MSAARANPFARPRSHSPIGELPMAPPPRACQIGRTAHQ